MHQERAGAWHAGTGRTGVPGGMRDRKCMEWGVDLGAMRWRVPRRGRRVDSDKHHPCVFQVRSALSEGTEGLRWHTEVMHSRYPVRPIGMNGE